jgi:hypothetical protein
MHIVPLNHILSSHFLLFPRDLCQEMFNAYRVRPSSSGIIRLVDYLLYVGK